MNIFNEIQLRRPKRNKFNLSHEKKLTMNMGNLVPILCQEILPGDKFDVSTEMLIRMTPLQAPIFQRVKNYTHYFFVPTRLVWDEFKDFITGGVTGTAAPVKPYIDMDNTSKTFFGTSSLADYMGLPTVDAATVVTNRLNIDALPFRAYQLIYNEYFRDQTLTPAVLINKTGGVIPFANPEFAAIMTMRKRSWEKDYFTSAMNAAQRGGNVLLPTTIQYSSPAKARATSGVLANADDITIISNPDAAGDAVIGANGDPVQIRNIDSLSTTINDLRTAARLQEWLEKNMRGGARYIEQILHHFGVKSSDARLQRPEYLGGGNNPIVISEVLSSFEDPAGTGDPLATMGGHGISVAGGHGFRRTFEEHGYVIGIMSVLPKTGYQQGVPKMYQRFTKLDYAWPEFGNLGEQEVKGVELYWDPVAVQGDGTEVFGYQSRFAEYKYQASTSHGDFRGPLAYWHQNRIFTAKPLLNANFVESNPSNRIFAVQTNTDKLLVNLYHRINAIRPLPYFGTPQL